MTNQTKTNNTSNEQEITLRCSKCGTPITPAQAVQTPIGYRCQDCIRKQQKIFNNSKPVDYVLGFLIAAGLSLFASFLILLIPFFTLLVVFLLAPATGVAIAEVVRKVTQKRRSKQLFRLVAAGVIIGGIPHLLIYLLNLIVPLSQGTFLFFGLLPLGYQILYLVLVVPSAYYRLTGSRRL